MLEIIINSFWFILPAYCANFFPVLLKGTHPIDFGKNFSDGQRWLGNGKTIEGFVGGILFGIFIGMLQIYAMAFIPHLSFPLFNHTFLTISLLSSGAIFGDLFGSFVKRRFGIKRGEPAPILDQLDFLIFSLVIVSLIETINLHQVIFLVIVTPFVHNLSNIFAFLLRIKNKPW
ncbi:MAG: CDP-2,3-bis-(O-geranylgeranyl)-sn-glycerol synthase [Candidatus Aenigmarchaeota archaeon]|nr:CDP-2,3-bis-(O-geranylgeranyl)-sn-glycerol synthase [Candidatus Aenigmarchaeota archaeon]